MTKKQILKKYFGYDSFFPLQAEIIDHVLSLNDALVLMPTGGGKSVCFQIPALMFDGVTIVISPLISLMKDQVEALKANGIAAEYLNSSLSAEEEKLIIERSLKGTLKLLYISPERLSSAGFTELLGGLKVSMFAVDEAHCISFWGHDFRPEYKRLSILKKRYPDVPLIALTATADRVIRRDILSQLNIPETKTFVASFDRPNLSLAVRPGLKRMRQITDFLKLHRRQPGIIYCLSRKSTESVAENLSKSGYKAKHYHAGMDNDCRNRTQNEFIRDEIQIICATVAFGMGIDKSNVRWVIHYNMPKNIESFYQEIGRCGRDGLPADTILFYSYADVMMQTEMLNEATPERRELLDAKLKRMKQYAEAESCRRRILLSYFNETITKDCGNCDVCKNPPQKFDGTIIAQKALSAITRTGEQINSTLLIDILRGSHNRQVIEKGYDKIKTWGIGRDIRSEEWSDYIFQILNLGYVDIAYDEGYTFKLNALSHLVLKNKINVMLVKYRPYKSREELVLPKEPAKAVLADQALFDRLKQLRKTIADQNNIPAYIVFSDKTLQAMTETMPTDKISMLEVSGVGQQKFATYGKLFLDEISGFMREKAAKGKKIKGATYILTHELFSQGKTLEQIAEERKLSPNTVLQHLIIMYEKGFEINLRQFISDKELNEVQGAIEVVGNAGGALKPIFDYLNERIDYSKIRIALAMMNKND